jgi:hypothetical protein
MSAVESSVAYADAAALLIALTMFDEAGQRGIRRRGAAVGQHLHDAGH